MSADPNAVDVAALAGLVCSLVDHVATLGDVIDRHDAEIKELRATAAEALAAAFEAQAKSAVGLGALDEELEALGRRVTSVHENLIRTLTRHYETKGHV